MGLTDEDIREILRIIDSSPLDELRIESEGFSLHVRRGAGGAALPPLAAAPAVTPAASSRPPAPAPAEADERDGLTVIASPMLGTFYRSEGPGRPPFVEVGVRVEPDTIVGIVEVMKMMNSVPAGITGTVVEVCAENAQLVEYGQALFRIEDEP
jgi:acetyl-CoA carboxylase biotin carboxyl carrier protein